MSRRAWTLALAIALPALGAAGLAAYAGWGAEEAEAPAAAAPAPPPPGPERRAGTPPPPPPSKEEPAEAPPTASDRGPSLEELRARLAEEERQADTERLLRRAREVKRQEEATARWSDGVSREELEARHVEPTVRGFFEELELEPVLRDGGLMEGLAIREVEPGGRAARAGLAPGDVIVRLDDEVLEDPARLPGLVARLSRPLPLCVERGERTRCLEVELD